MIIGVFHLHTWLTRRLNNPSRYHYYHHCLHSNSHRHLRCCHSDSLNLRIHCLLSSCPRYHLSHHLRCCLLPSNSSIGPGVDVGWRLSRPTASELVIRQ